MRVVALSNPDTSFVDYMMARNQGYITFIYHHADRQHALCENKFFYVRTDEELMEKINFLEADITVQEEVARM
jgi:hypothetical protein